MRRLPVLICVLSMVSVTSAAIVGVAHGSGSPPATLGPYTIEALPFDTRSVYTDVTDAPGNPPLTGDLGFDRACSLRHIGMGWMTWSHGYTGVIYFTNYSSTVTIQMPADTAAFMFYAEPNPFRWEDITATAYDQFGGSTSVTQRTHGSSGATGFGFCGEDGSVIDYIDVSISGGTDFGFGEFYGQIPEPSTLGLLGLVGLFVLRRR